METWVFYMCDASWVCYEKAEKGGSLFCQLNQSCWQLQEMDRSSLKKFPCLAAGGGGFLPNFYISLI